ncbi:unnamed protein product [Owenia fusiformis]|uniref:Uncharacterized protein n=1 Tax=Owenia fusiformis TaxID=6347 RepID=A0A8J1T6B6_OWEFU|nr:unnamed protein product [Owenia fusiformis]
MSGWLSNLRLILSTTAVVVPVTVTVLDIFGYVARVEGASMQPALNPKEERGADYVFLNKWKIRNYQFQRGEVVALMNPADPEQKMIKRIVALEGDTVKTLSFKNKYIKVRDGHCWLEGDNHSHSLDSNLFGPISQGLITAKASHIVWPPHRMGRLRVIEENENRVTKHSLYNQEIIRQLREIREMEREDI